jgi:hypothetical protein
MTLVRVCANDGAVQIADFIEHIVVTMKNLSESILLTLFMQFVHVEVTATQDLRSPRVSKVALYKIIESQTAGEVLNLFPKVTQLDNYSLADGWTRWDSFDWIDVPAPTPTELEIWEMENVVDELIKGGREMCETLWSSSSGVEGNLKQGPFLCVLFWLLLRSGKEITEEQTKIILGVFSAFHSVNLTNNTNVLELSRLRSTIPIFRSSIVIEKFMERES